MELEPSETFPCLPPAANAAQQPKADQPLVDWDTGLLDCFEDASTCCYGFWCCPCLACTVSERFGENRCLPLCDILCSNPFVKLAYGYTVCFPPPAALALRAAMRNRYGIKGSLCKDIAATCFCEWCAWCQLHRELKHRKKSPTVVVMQNQTIVQMQPAAGATAPPFQPQPGFMHQPEAAVPPY